MRLINESLEILKHGILVGKDSLSDNSDKYKSLIRKIREANVRLRVDYFSNNKWYNERTEEKDGVSGREAYKFIKNRIEAIIPGLKEPFEKIRFKVTYRKLMDIHYLNLVVEARIDRKLVPFRYTIEIKSKGLFSLIG